MSNGSTWQLEIHKEWAECGWRIIDAARIKTLEWFNLPLNDVTHDILCDYEIGEKNLEETERALEAERISEAKDTLKEGERQTTKNEGG